MNFEQDVNRRVMEKLAKKMDPELSAMVEARMNARAKGGDDPYESMIDTVGNPHMEGMHDAKILGIGGAALGGLAGALHSSGVAGRLATGLGGAGIGGLLGGLMGYGIGREGQRITNTEVLNALHQTGDPNLTWGEYETHPVFAEQRAREAELEAARIRANAEMNAARIRANAQYATANRRNY